jgi:hypothetical protein
MPPPKTFTNSHISTRKKWPSFSSKSEPKIQTMQSLSSLKVCFQWTRTLRTSKHTNKSANSTTPFCWLTVHTISVTLDKKAEDFGRFRDWQICQMCCCWVLAANAWVPTLDLLDATIHAWLNTWSTTRQLTCSLTQLTQFRLRLRWQTWEFWDRKWDVSCERKSLRTTITCETSWTRTAEKCLATRVRFCQSS